MRFEPYRKGVTGPEEKIAVLTVRFGEPCVKLAAFAAGRAQDEEIGRQHVQVEIDLLRRITDCYACVPVEAHSCSAFIPSKNLQTRSLSQAERSSQISIDSRQKKSRTYHLPSPATSPINFAPPSSPPPPPPPFVFPFAFRTNRFPCTTRLVRLNRCSVRCSSAARWDRSATSPWAGKGSKGPPRRARVKCSTGASSRERRVGMSDAVARARAKGEGDEARRRRWRRRRTVHCVAKGVRGQSRR